jgi:hypothetical protein
VRGVLTHAGRRKPFDLASQRHDALLRQRDLLEQLRAAGRPVFCVHIRRDGLEVMDESRLEPRTQLGLLLDGLERPDRGFVRGRANQPAEKTSEPPEPGRRRAGWTDERSGITRALDGTAEGREGVVVGAIGLVPFVLKTCNRIFERSIVHWDGRHCIADAAGDWQFCQFDERGRDLYDARLT